MPFGLCNAAQRMCRLMDKVIPGALRDRVFVYLDDLLIVSPDFQTHIELLEQVANCLEQAGLTINVSKSQFCFKELCYLGYIVGGGKLRPDPQKTETILKYDYPKTARQVRSFMGAAGWYRRFIADYATISSPIFNTLKKSKSFSFSDEAKNAFDKLKTAPTSSPVLIQADFTRSFFVQWSGGVGAVLFQKDDTDGEDPIAFFSHKPISAQRNYSVTERECLAGYKRSSCALEFVLQPFNFEIEHRFGSKNVVPDTLSRYNIEQVSCEVGQLVDLDSEEFRQELSSFDFNYSGERRPITRFARVTPYFALFGMNMIGHGSVYRLARKLRSLGDTETQILPSQVKLDLIRERIKENLHRAYLWGARGLCHAAIKSCYRKGNTKVVNVIKK
ncbi:Retrovirus-related Pol polyprotein from transposon 17.6 [Eumeta japonica]|uniref:RNA-directed DNA polymerase n=1 Tax=Eumeta variegata TaxID=151549 RepID=A0A4C1TEV8_EUMVA|nr:Retrovirus-related Pol polyprotein from transposon 17.6 [Eumeta japonica]